MSANKKYIGAPLSRIEGALKVTGKAPYTAEFPVKNLGYGFPVQSTIAAGKIASIDTGEAEKQPGVIRIITHKNALKLQPGPPVTNANRMTRANPVLQNTTILFYGQYIGIVVAETYEQARHAARLVKVTYTNEKPKISFDEHVSEAYKPAVINADYPTDTSWGN